MAVHTKHGRRPKRGSGKSNSSSATKADRVASGGKREAPYAADEDRSSNRDWNIAGLKKAAQLKSDLNDRKVDLIKADLNAASTFASIARESDDEDKRLRNRKNARRGYDTILHFLSTAKLTQRDADEINGGVARLRRALLELGDTFPQS